MEKLISMVDFVLQQRMTSDQINDASFQQIQNHIATYYDKVFAYANFLKQPLNLGMFVPCHDGKIIPHPDENLEFGNEDSFFWNLHKTQYKEAKEKVLFKDCEARKIRDHYVVFYNSKQLWLSWTNRTVEDLINREVELTESAIKQIFGDA